MTRAGTNGTIDSSRPHRATSTESDLTADAKSAWRLLTHPAVKVLAALVALAAAALAGRYLVQPADVAELRQEMKGKATVETLRIAVGERLATHRNEADPHPPITKKLDKLERNQEAIRDDVAKYGAKFENVLDAIKELRADVRRTRRDP